DEQRLAAERRVSAAREAMEAARLAAQETHVRRAALAEQFAQTRCQLPEVLANLDAAASVPAWEQSLEEARAEIERLGQVNLAAGVAVMARPPGKKNSTIHLLSGGEKALTAVALVFAIFDLNPAPFCLLDEVDAPLDEHNVGRFCDIVREMSTRVQFVFIT